MMLPRYFITLLLVPSSAIATEMVRNENPDQVIVGAQRADWSSARRPVCSCYLCEITEPFE
jgi:hypothetical protein